MTTLGTLIPVPPKLLYPEVNDSKDPQNKANRESYANLSPEDKLDPEKGKGKWWSMHDLMTEFHSSFLPVENDATYLSYKVDFSAPELKVAAVRDPQLRTALDQQMLPGLTKKQNEIQERFNQQQQQNAQQIQQSVMGAALRTSQGAVGTTAPGAVDATGAVIGPLPWSAENLEMECLNDLSQIILNSKNRIFVTDGNARAISLGGRKLRKLKGYKTHKHKKHGKKHNIKGRTQRRRRYSR